MLPSSKTSDFVEEVYYECMRDVVERRTLAPSTQSVNLIGRGTEETQSLAYSDSTSSLQNCMRAMIQRPKRRRVEEKDEERKPSEFLGSSKILREDLKGANWKYEGWIMSDSFEKTLYRKSNPQVAGQMLILSW